MGALEETPAPPIRPLGVAGGVGSSVGGDEEPQLTENIDGITFAVTLDTPTFPSGLGGSTGRQQPPEVVLSLSPQPPVTAGLGLHVGLDVASTSDTASDHRPRTATTEAPYFGATLYSNMSPTSLPNGGGALLGGASVLLAEEGPLRTADPSPSPERADGEQQQPQRQLTSSSHASEHHHHSPPPLLDPTALQQLTSTSGAAVPPSQPAGGKRPIPSSATGSASDLCLVQSHHSGAALGGFSSNASFSSNVAGYTTTATAIATAAASHPNQLTAFERPPLRRDSAASAARDAARGGDVTPPPMRDSNERSLATAGFDIMDVPLSIGGGGATPANAAVPSGAAVAAAVTVASNFSAPTAAASASELVVTADETEGDASSPPTALMSAFGFSRRRLLIVQMMRTTVSAAHTHLKAHLTISSLIGHATSAVGAFEHLLTEDYAKFRDALQTKDVETVINKGPPASRLRSLERSLEESRIRFAKEKAAAMAGISKSRRDRQGLMRDLAALEDAFMAAFSSEVEDLEPLAVDDLIWLRMTDWVGEVKGSASAAFAAAAEAEGFDTHDGEEGGGAQLLRANRNRAVSFRNLGAAAAAAEAATAAATAKRHYVDRNANVIPFEGTGLIASTTVSGSRRGISELHASINEEYVTHISVYIPPVLRRVPPFGNSCPSWLTKDLPQRLTLSAMTLLQYVMNANERLHFITNAFKVSGIDCVPVLVVLTDCSLKLFAYSRINANGDIFIAQRAGGADDDDANPLSGAGGATSSPSASLSRNSAGVGGMNPNTSFAATQFKRLKRWVRDADKKAAIGEKVSKSVARLSSETNRGTCWLYDVNVFTSARLCSYLHQEAAVDIGMTWDSGPMLAIMDQNLSMVKDARKAFTKALKSVCQRVNESFTVIDEDDILKNHMRAWQAAHQNQWVCRSLSTYDYLTQLNAVCGRALKDWNQYPVFPWVVKDHASAVLDLASPNSYRDLAWPIHAQSADARSTAEMRYDELSSDGQEPWHHSTHYTSSAAVLHYLLRLQPFLAASAAYQGGRLDHADRLFASVGTAFKNATTNSADCKELLPDFYRSCGGAFLRNIDGMNLGVLQSGAALGDVALPPWAKKSPRVFTFLMRQALESEHVSMTIHGWFDLIFGAAQTGEGAVRTFNVHKPLTYPEEVRRRLAKEETDLGRSQILCEVQNFGQTPRAAFTLEHPRRMPIAEVGKTSVTHFMLLTPQHYGIKEPTNLFRTPGSLVERYANAAAGRSNNRAVPLVIAGVGGAAGGGTDPLASSLMSQKSPVPLSGGLTSPTSATGGALAVPYLDPSGFPTAPPGGYAPAPIRKLIHYEHVQSSVKGDRLTFTTDFVVPVSRTDYCICFVPDEFKFYKHSMVDGRFVEAITVPTALSCKVSAVVAMNRQAAFIVGTTSGHLFAVATETVLTAAYVANFLTAHTHPIVGIQACADANTILTWTDSADDQPAVWRYVRRYPALVARLGFKEAVEAFYRGQAETAAAAASAQAAAAAANAGGASFVASPMASPLPPPPPSAFVVRAACVDRRETTYIIASDRAIVAFDASGIAMGSGGLPPNDERRSFPTITAIAALEAREWVENGTMVYVTGHEGGYLGIWRVVRRTPQSVTADRLIDIHFAHLLHPDDKDETGDVTITALHVATDGTITIGRRNGRIKTMFVNREAAGMVAPTALAAAKEKDRSNAQSSAPPSLAQKTQAQREKERMDAIAVAEKREKERREREREATRQQQQQLQQLQQQQQQSSAAASTVATPASAHPPREPTVSNASFASLASAAALNNDNSIET